MACYLLFFCVGFFFKEIQPLSLVKRIAYVCPLISKFSFKFPCVSILIHLEAAVLPPWRCTRHPSSRRGQLLPLILPAHPSQRACTPLPQHASRACSPPRLRDPGEVPALQQRTGLQFLVLASYPACLSVQALRRDLLAYMHMLEVTPLEPRFVHFMFLVVHVTPGTLLVSLSLRGLR